MSHYIPPSKRRTLILSGVAKASKIRQAYGISPIAPVCPFDIAQKLGLDVRFVNDIKSMEGVYLHPHAILLSSLRPVGRQSFTLAHEVGHHVFGHVGGHVFLNAEDKTDEQATSKYTPEEILADSFAAYLLMPKMAVMNAIKQRSIDIQNCCPEEIYEMAWFFGVGYETLIRHMQATKILQPEVAAQLRKTAPKKIRTQLLGETIKEDLIPVNHWWKEDHPVNCQVGDLILLPPHITVSEDEKHITLLESSQERTLVKAQSVGCGRISDENSDWALYVRVQQREYKGRACYRFLPAV
jgi:Zn-dependent peptidase ImmA (M78 family)